MKTTERKTQQIIGRAVDELAAALDAGQSERLKAYLAAMGRFHRYSWANVLLIHMAFPSATHVAGYRTWQRLGRKVRRGAKAIHILAPVVRKVENEAGESERVVGFRDACVFDVSQTEGKALPEFARVGGEPHCSPPSRGKPTGNHSPTCGHNFRKGGGQNLRNPQHRKEALPREAMVR